jgi:hypothetical protein
MDCHRFPNALDQVSTTPARVPIEEKKTIAEIFKQELSSGEVRQEHVLKYKKELEARLPSFQDNMKYLKRVLDVARKLVKTSGNDRFHPLCIQEIIIQELSLIVTLFFTQYFIEK